MITSDDKLRVFEDFYVDTTLPKHVRPEKDDVYVMDPSGPITLVSRGGRGVFHVIDVEKRPSRISTWFARLAFWRNKPDVEQHKMSVEEFFSSIKNTAKELNIVKDRAIGYERAMTNARKTGQQALLEQLAGGLNAHRMEAQLVAIGLTKFIEEQDIVRFYKQSTRGLRLDWIKNFTRFIPDDVIALKERADELGIFDNYAILHYDPEAKSYAETKEEKERRKDPILFGLMKDRRVLYVVGDWVDEVCDLTLDQVADQIGHDSIKTLCESAHPYRDE